MPKSSMLGLGSAASRRRCRPLRGLCRHRSRYRRGRASTPARAHSMHPPQSTLRGGAGPLWRASPPRPCVPTRGPSRPLSNVGGCAALCHRRARIPCDRRGRPRVPVRPRCAPPYRHPPRDREPPPGARLRHPSRYAPGVPRPSSGRPDSVETKVAIQRTRVHLRGAPDRDQAVPIGARSAPSATPARGTDSGPLTQSAEPIVS